MISPVFISNVDPVFIYIPTHIREEEGVYYIKLYNLIHIYSHVYVLSPVFAFAEHSEGVWKHVKSSLVSG